MKPFVLIVEFEIKAEDYDKFHPLIAKNARLSVQLEPGCSVFDVVSSPEDRSKITLYEVYDDEEAFKAHMAMPHVAEFFSAAKPMIVNQSARKLTRTAP
jgi:(4S)-4-hydroxy-5-phosphonooxypentane-2,3-dione isomerase